MKPQADWPVTFFDDDYLRIYRTSFTPEKTNAEVEFIAASLAAPAGAAVLDLACGLGRHALGMAARGFQVTGVDFNARYLEIAAQEASRAGLDIRWRQADMRALDFAAEFDAIYSFFTSFGYYADEENEAVLDRIARALRPGGRLLLDLINRDFILTHGQQRFWNHRDDGSLVMEEVTFDLARSRVQSRLTLVTPEGPRVMKEFELRTYTCAELSALLRNRGFEIEGDWGGADRSAYTTESPRLVLLARLQS